MSSKYQRKNRKAIGLHVDSLVSHITGMDESDENVGIARKYIWNQFDSNSFPDPNEHLTKNQISNLILKLRLHS